MINLEQVQKLEKKVHSALTYISELREENKMLRDKLAGSQKKMAELEELVDTFKREQDSIEQGILSVLSKLDKLEDEVSTKDASPRPGAPPGKKDAAPTGGNSPAAPAAPPPPPHAEVEKPLESGDQDELDIF